MNKHDQAWNSLWKATWPWLPVIGGICVLILSAFLRGFPAPPDALLFGQLQFTSGIVAITFAGSAFVRFRGTRERLPLILAAGFVLVGVTLAGSSLGLEALSPIDSTASLRDPMTWVIGRTLLATLLGSALLVEKRYAWSRNPARDITAALGLVAVAAALLSAGHRILPINLVVYPNSFFPRPGNLVPAILFLLAAVGYHHHLRKVDGIFERSLYLAATINFWCSVSAAQSDRRLDATFVLAAVLQFCSYAVLLGGALLDNVHLFQHVQRLAVTDPVTGLANYRQLIDSLEVEMQRTSRTGRTFVLLLFDLDGLKKINDQYGHQVGTRALCRAADVLRLHSRAIDTGARHGGDEFALVLPEATEQGGREVLTRVCDCVANDGEQPTIFLSAGLAVYPLDGNSVEALMDAADRELYRMKEQHRSTMPDLKRIGA
ncbi:MAG: GGDEF domain-containing protein [Candidatus Acidiferrum sp.]